MLLGHLRVGLKSKMAAKNPIWPPKYIKSEFSELNLLLFELFSTGYDVQYPRQMIKS